MEYVLTSSEFEGEVLFEFNPEGLVIKCDLSGAKLSKEQHQWITKRLQVPFEGWLEYMSHSKTSKFQEVQVDFELFWSKYDDKMLSSKKRTKAKWDKMKRSDQVKAYYFMTRYFGSLPSGVRKKMAETYLNAELWNN